MMPPKECIKNNDTSLKRKIKPSILKEIDFSLLNLIIHKLRVYLALKTKRRNNT